MGARGVGGRARMLPKEATLRCCSGLVSMGARGMRVHARLLPEKAILRCCSGLVIMGAQRTKLKKNFHEEVDLLHHLQ